LPPCEAPLDVLAAGVDGLVPLPVRGRVAGTEFAAARHVRARARASAFRKR
jgi:hypothetical protein